MKKFTTLILCISLCYFSNAQNCSGGSIPVTVDLNLTGIESWDGLGSANNAAGSISVGSQMDVSGITWNNVAATLNGGTFCSEADFQFAGIYGTNINTGGTGVCGPFTNPMINIITPFATDATGGITWESYESFDDVANTIDATFTSGTITLHACPTGEIITYPPPSNDECLDAITLDCGDIDVAGTNFAGDDDMPGACNGGGDGISFGVWYTYSTTTNKTVTITVNPDPGTGNDLGDSQLAVYSGTCAGLVCVDGNDDSTPPGGLGSQVTFNAIQGTDYYIYVNGFGSGNEGDFLISLECCAPMNNVSLSPTGATTSTTANTCEEGSWTYYEDTNNPGTYFFAIEWDPSSLGNNAAAKASADVSVTLDAAIGSATSGTDGTWTMKRYWNVTNAPIVDPVNVKFFYDPAEITEIETAEAAWPGVQEAFVWFKTVGADFDPTAITSAGVGQGSIELIDVSGGATENGVSFAQFDGISSFSGGTGAIGDGSGTPLPVELISFTGEAMSRTNKLRWATASEINNSYFEIERSINGEDFEDIGRVYGHGFSSEIINYEFSDEQPANKGYYRLRQTDFDGTYAYSDIILIERDDKGIFISSVIPNPTKDYSTILFNSDTKEGVYITLTNISGQQIGKTKFIETYDGINEYVVDLSFYPSGVYFATIFNGNKKDDIKLIKSDL